MTPATQTSSSPDRASTDDALQILRPPDYPEKLVRILAGVVTLTGLGLGFFVSPWWYLLTAFAGANILQSAFTGFCPPEILYRWLKR
jgi:hypothetical protein